MSDGRSKGSGSGGGGKRRVQQKKVGDRKKDLHLRIVRDEDVFAEVKRRDALLAERRRLAEGTTPAECSGEAQVTQLPSGVHIVPGFQLKCVHKKGHPGYCRDVTGLAFQRDTRGCPGMVVFWDGADDEDILQLAQDLGEM